MTVIRILIGGGVVFVWFFTWCLMGAARHGDEMAERFNRNGG